VSVAGLRLSFNDVSVRPSGGTKGAVVARESSSDLGARGAVFMLDGMGMEAGLGGGEASELPTADGGVSCKCEPVGLGLYWSRADGGAGISGSMRRWEG